MSARPDTSYTTAPAADYSRYEIGPAPQGRGGKVMMAFIVVACVLLLGAATIIFSVIGSEMSPLKWLSGGQ